MLQKLIDSLEYGEKVHVAVWSMERPDALPIEFRSQCHSSPICESMKKKPCGLKKCLRCKDLALQKAVRTGEPFCGTCIHGIYEYCIPVTENGKVTCVVFAGCNTLTPTEEERANCKRTAESVATGVAYFPREKRTSADTITDMLKSYVDHFYANDLSLSGLANYYHYNEKYLGRMFLRQAGVSFRAYLQETRLKAACRQLERTADSVTKIAMDTGFNSVTYFNRAFHSRYGMSPTAYRAGWEERIAASRE